jgi:hypothetical protein
LRSLASSLFDKVRAYVKSGYPNIAPVEPEKNSRK